MLPVAAAFALAGLRQQLVYRVANAAGLFTNLMFLIFRTGVMEACFTHTSQIGGLDPLGATSFAAITQATLMVSPQWGTMGLTSDVRSGQIVVVLQRPIDPYIAYAAVRLGSSLFMVFGRMLPILIVSWLMGLLSPPTPTCALGFCLSLTWGAIVALELQILVECSSFWLDSDKGVRMLVFGVGTMASGLLLPLSWYPDLLQSVFRALPFSATLNTPTEIWLGMASCSAMGAQIAWVVALGVAGRGLLALGLRRLAAHGG